jgi:hypothetical protein
MTSPTAEAIAENATLYMVITNMHAAAQLVAFVLRTESTASIAWLAERVVARWGAHG